MLKTISLDKFNTVSPYMYTCVHSLILFPLRDVEDFYSCNKVSPT